MRENKEVIDNGGEYQFAPDITTTRLPAGVYYPDYDHNGQFILVESTDSSGTEEEESDGKPFGEIVHEHEERVVVNMDNPSSNGWTNHTSESDKETADSDSPMEHVGADWANESYFPLEDYNDELAAAESNINKFIEAKTYYDENGIDYRRSLLFYGPPGTGKSQYVSNKSLELVKKFDAVVVRLETHAQVEIFAEDGMREIADGLPNRLKIVVFEELSEVVEADSIRQYIVNILDSQQLRNNVIFLATTNEPAKLPKNFVDRPGRLDFLHGVKAEDNDPSYIPKFYEHLIGEKYPVEDEEWTKMIGKELTPAYVKGLFITAKERNQNLKETYKHIERRRRLVENNFKEPGDGPGFHQKNNELV